MCIDFSFRSGFVNNRLVLAKFPFVPASRSKIELFAIRSQSCQHRGKREGEVEAEARWSEGNEKEGGKRVFLFRWKPWIFFFFFLVLSLERHDLSNNF